MRFRDRQDAGRLLAERLTSHQLADPVVLALPRGGVAVGAEVARALHAPLDVILVRKIGAPGQPELALGAIAEGGQPDLVSPAPNVMPVSSAFLEQATAAARAEIARRRMLYPAGAPPIAGREAIVVDDGIATGATVAAALRAVRHRRPARVILAVPVAAPDALARLSAEADEIVCLQAPEEFYAVGQFYDDFTQLDDADVIALLAEAAQRSGAKSGA